MDFQRSMKTAPIPQLTLVLPEEAVAGFASLLQHGILFAVDRPVAILPFLLTLPGFTPEYIEKTVQTIFINGVAADSLDRSLAAGSTLALSAAMPGLAGAIFRRQGLHGSLRSQPVAVVEPPVHPVDTTITSREVTAFVNKNRPDYFALKKMQIRFNPDGSIEASGKLDLNYVMDVILAGNVTKQEIEERLPISLDLLPKSVNVYTHFDGKIIDNQLTGLEMHSVKIYGISIPQSILGEEIGRAHV